MQVFSQKFLVFFSSQNLNVIDAYHSLEPSIGFKLCVQIFNLYICHFYKTYTLCSSRNNDSYVKKKIKNIFS